MIRLYSTGDPTRLRASSLSGLKVTTLGSRFLGLSTVCFRRMLRQKGAKVDKRIKRSLDVIVLGDKLSLSNNLALARICEGESAPVITDHWTFAGRFIQTLRTFELKQGLTLEKHLASQCGNVPEAIAQALNRQDESQC